MVDTQVRPNDVTKYPIIAAMLDVPREEFVPDSRRDIAYIGDNIELGDGRVMLEPRTLAKMIDTLDVQPTDLVLDIGCGLGYSAAVLGLMAQAVVAIEEHPEMAASAATRLARINADNVVSVHGRLNEGQPSHGPYDAIFIGGGGVEVVPDAIAAQLADGGRIVALFLDGELGIVRLGIKLDGRIDWQRSFNAGAPLLPGFHRPERFVL